MLKKAFTFVSVILIIGIGSISLLSAAAPNKFENVTILVPSCDKYQELWKPFYTLLFKAWPSLKTYNANVPIIMIGNKKSYDDPRVKMVLTGEDKSWSDNMLLAMKAVKTDYVIIILEDYFFNQPVNEVRLNEVFEGMKKIKAAYIQIGGIDHRPHLIGEPYPGLNGINIKSKHSQYRTSLQAAIWSKAKLEWLLKPGESAWDFEIPGSLRSEGIHAPFLASVDNPPFIHLNGAQQGYWNKEVLEYIKSQGIEMKDLKLPIDEEHKIYLWYKRVFLPYGYNEVFLPLKNWVLGKK